MAKLKKIGVLSAAKVYAVLMIIGGLIYGLILAIASVFLNSASLLSLLLYIVGIPIAYAILGFIMGAIGAWLYNVVAGWIGGIEMEFAK